MRFYRLVFERLTPAAEFAPNADQSGPVIRIYALPSGTKGASGDDQVSQAMCR